MKLFKQQTDYTCGPTSLLMAMSVFGEVPTSEWFLAQKAKSNSNIGTTRYQMQRVPRLSGYKVSHGTGANLDYLRSRLPAIVLFKDTPSSFHYSVITKVGDNVTIADPWYGEERSIPKQEFIDSWVCHNGTKAWWMSISLKNL